MAKKMPYLTKIAPQERENGGYWDGRNARQRGRHAPWVALTPSWVSRARHPFDDAYGRGYWIGWYGEEPHKSAMADSVPVGAAKAFLLGQA